MEFNEEVVLKIIALTIGTTDKKELTPNHYLNYLLQKLYGLDSLVLDNLNTEIYNRLVEIKEEY